MLGLFVASDQSYGWLGAEIPLTILDGIVAQLGQVWPVRCPRLAYLRAHPARCLNRSALVDLVREAARGLGRDGAAPACAGAAGAWQRCGRAPAPACARRKRCRRGLGP